MTWNPRFVCVVCDVHKPDAVRLNDRDWCDGCGKRTANREVASPNAVIAPGSALRFRDQRRIYEESA